MTDYSKGKIYKIQDNGLNMCYIGSTVQPLCKRMAQHRKDFKRYLNKIDRKNTSIFRIFDECGVENCKIELVEQYPCESKEELMAREGFFIKEMDCVNKNIAGRTREEYFSDNSEMLSEKRKIHYQENRKEIIEKNKQYGSDNREKISERKKTHYRDNKNLYSERNRKQYEKRKIQANQNKPQE